MNHRANAEAPAGERGAAHAPELPCTVMRGGTSKAAFFLAADLPPDPVQRDRLVLAVMGHGDARQIDGIGGGTPLTTKVAIVSPSASADVDYLFGQVVAAESRIDYAPTCGNILAGVGPFAIERGLAAARDPQTVVRIRMVNTNSYCTAQVCTPRGQVTYDGDTRIAGVPGSAAPVLLTFADIAGSSCGALLPTGAASDVVDDVSVTCIDHGMPVVVIRAQDLGATGYEEPRVLDANSVLKARIERIRQKAGRLMGLGDVAAKVVPKVTLVARPRDGGTIHTRTFIPRVCHDAIGVLGAVSVASACILEGSVAVGIAAGSPEDVQDLSIEHPSGEFTVRLSRGAGPGEITSAALLRTARALFRGRAAVPGRLS